MNRRDVLAGGIALALAGRVRAASAKADAGQAHGLVISLGYDETADPLPNTRNDGKLIADRLGQLRFGSVDYLADPDEAAFTASLQAYAGKLKRGQLAFVYYAGHAAQIDGVNYLLMTDGATFISMQSVIETLRGATDTVVMLLDGCRNDPTKALVSKGGAASRAVTAVELRKAAASAGALTYSLKKLEPGGAVGRVRAFELQGTGVRVVFATDPNNVAQDGATIFDRNSPFAMAVAKRLLEKRSLDDVITLATGDVVTATGGAQSPWSQGSIGRPIFLAGPPENKNPAKVPFQVPG